MLRPLRLKMGMLRLCATETFARLCATQNRYVAAFCYPKRYVATIATQKGMLRLWATEIFARLCATQISYVTTLCEPCCDFERLMIRPCSTHDSNLFDSIDPIRLYRPYSTLSTLFDPWFEHVRLMIRPCFTHDSTVLDSWFDLIWLNRPCSIHDSTLFDPWFDFVRLYCSFDHINLRRKPDYAGPCRSNHESNISARATHNGDPLSVFIDPGNFIIIYKLI